MVRRLWFTRVPATARTFATPLSPLGSTRRIGRKPHSVTDAGSSRSATSQPNHRPSRKKSFPESTSDFSPHHLYAAGLGSADIEQHLAFRDQLKHNSTDRAAHTKLKIDLAPHADAVGYLQAKTEFIKAVLYRIGW